MRQQDPWRDDWIDRTAVLACVVLVLFLGLELLLLLVAAAIYLFG